MSQALLGTDQQECMDCLGRMRGIIKRLTEAAPGLLSLTMELRHEMMDLTSRLQALRCTQAAQRMTGEAPPLREQAPIAEMPLFAHKNGHVLTPLDVERMRETLHRAGDHTLDGEEAE